MNPFIGYTTKADNKKRRYRNYKQMKVTLILIGKTTNAHFIAGISDYVSRIEHYLPFSIITIPELKNTKSLQKNNRKSVKVTSYSKNCSLLTLWFYLMSMGRNTDLLNLHNGYRRNRIQPSG